MKRVYPTIYSAKNDTHVWEVYKPDTGTSYYVRKRSLKNDKSIGKDRKAASELTAKAYADRMAKPSDRPTFRFA